MRQHSLVYVLSRYVLFTVLVMGYTFTARFFNHWLEAYRAKLVLKAIASVFNWNLTECLFTCSAFSRARYLRLPTDRVRVISRIPPMMTPPSSSGSPPHESTPVSNTKPYSVRPRSSSISRRNSQILSNERHSGNEALHNHEPTSSGGRSRLSRLSRSPFGTGQGTGIVSLLRTNVHQDEQGKSDLSPPRPKFPFSLTNHRGSGVNGSGSQDISGPSLFTSVNAQSTPPIRRPRSNASDDVGGRKAEWNRFAASSGVRRLSLSVASQLTESPSSP